MSEDSPADQQAQQAAADAWTIANAVESTTALLARHYLSLVQAGVPEQFAYMLTSQWYAHMLTMVRPSQ